ncbi:GIY-YIG nuclease family protein [Roseibium sp.]|uniref:GIY-YIG nuclease family protein n=1 Tax=Roseibium sp. TaxID=1936156 RepID=UPI003A970102
MEVASPLALPLVRLGNPPLDPGFYLYCGSARGPGGLKARVGRHLRRNKQCRWHVDHITSQCTAIAAMLTDEFSECDLRRRVEDRLSTTMPIEGFGASDCDTCQSHLVMLQCQSRIVRRTVNFGG